MSIALPLPQRTAYRASVLHFHADPAFHASSHSWHQDGLLVVADGKIEAVGDYAQLYSGLPAGTKLLDHRGKLIVPGFIDTHVHFRRPT